MPGRRVHADDVLGRGLLAHQEHRPRRLVRHLVGALGGQRDAAGGGAGAGGQALGEAPSCRRPPRRARPRRTRRQELVRCRGSTRSRASLGSITPSSTMSTAIRTAAGPVRLPVRVWSM